MGEKQSLPNRKPERAWRDSASVQTNISYTLSMSLLPTLFLRISPDDLTLARTGDAGVTAYRHRINRRVSFTLNLREALAAAPKTVTADVARAEVYLTIPVVTVPLSEFSEAEAETIHHTAFRAEPRSRVLYDPLPADEMVLVYAVGDHVCHAVEEAFPAVAYHNALSPVLQRGNPAATEGHTLLAYPHEDRTDAILWQGRRLLALNTFATKNADDATFFLLGMAQALGLAAEELHVAVAGEARRQASLAASISRFVKAAETLPAEKNSIPYALACAMTFTAV